MAGKNPNPTTQTQIKNIKDILKNINTNARGKLATFVFNTNGNIIYKDIYYNAVFKLIRNLIIKKLKSNDFDEDIKEIKKILNNIKSTEEFINNLFLFNGGVDYFWQIFAKKILNIIKALEGDRNALENEFGIEINIDNKISDEFNKNVINKIMQFLKQHNAKYIKHFYVFNYDDSEDYIVVIAKITKPLSQMQ